MEEWKEYKLGDVCDLIPGFAFKSADFGNYSTKAIKIKDIQPPFVDTDGADGVNIAKYDINKLSKFVVRKGDFILAMTGATIGKIGRYIDEIPAYLNQRVLRFAPKEIVDFDFVYYYLSTKHFQTYIINHIDSESAQPNISGNTISKYPIHLPNRIIQERISAILKSLDDKIEVNRRINDNLEQQAQALFKHWFIDFAPFKDGKFVESELGMIPEGWRVGTLGDIADITMGQSPAGSSYNEKGEGIIFYQGRTEFGFRYPSVRLYTTEPKRFAEPLSTLLSVRAPVGDINVATEKCCIGRGLASIKSKMNCHSYIFYLLQSLNKRFDVYNGEGTVFGSINKDTLNGLKLLIPSNSIMSAFEEIVEVIDGKILESHQESLRLATLRDTLLPKLMSGELKVN